MKTTLIIISSCFVALLTLGAIEQSSKPPSSGLWNLVNTWPGNSREKAGAVYVSGVSLTRCQAAKAKWEKTDPDSWFGCRSQ
jgi:hypothetical protein